MPTHAQLQAERWWREELTTPQMDWLGDELCRRTGRPRDAAGIKGDNHHLRGAHRSQDWILHSRWCTNRTYTVQSGLTAEQRRHIAGFDFTPAGVEQMIAQSRRLMAAVKAGRLEQVREIYCNVDGDRVVDGWDNVRNRAARSDSSHLWHWHLSIDRRHCADQALMQRILAIALGEHEGEDMPLNDADLEKIQKTVWQAPIVWVGGRGQHPPGTRPAAQVVSYAHGDAYDTMTAVAALRADVATALGRDPVDEQQIVQGILAGLGAKSPDEVAAALAAVMSPEQAHAVGLLLTQAQADQ